MPNSHYQAGYVLERAARTLLTVNGYLVIRASGSKGPADLVALKPGEVLLIQCKASERQRLGPAERAELHGAAQLAGATALACRWARNGHQARYPEFLKLIGTGKSSFEPWTPDYALETT